MLLRMIYDEKLAQAAYLIGCQRTGEALIIDPERDVDRYLEIALREGMRITAIAETHIHADFLSGARELAEQTGAKLYLSDEGTADWKYQWLNSKQEGGSYDHQLLKHGDAFMVGNIRIEAVHSPGHTPEHLCYLVTDRGAGANEPIGIITGDFVFVGDVGRPDLLETAAGEAGAKEPAARELFRSLQDFHKLPDFIQVWPAHGAGSACGKAMGAVPQSTVGYEKRFNLAVSMALDNEDRFVESILDGQPEPPLYFSRMKHENKMGPAILGALPEPHPMTAADLDRIAQHNTDAVIIDTRSWQEFRSGHLQGSVYAPLNRAFPTVTGSYLQAEQKIYLVVDAQRLKEAVTDLIHIGLDTVVGYVEPRYLNDYLAENPNQQITTANLTVQEFSNILPAKDDILLDVRGASEFAAGHLHGAMNIAHTRLGVHLDELPRDQKIYVYCKTGARSAVATAFLQRNGFDAVDVLGGYSEMVKAGMPMEKDEADVVTA
jgi:hydroxyacylglutathione hydrolase